MPIPASTSSTSLSLPRVGTSAHVGVEVEVETTVKTRSMIVTPSSAAMDRHDLTPASSIPIRTTRRPTMMILSRIHRTTPTSKKRFTRSTGLSTDSSTGRQPIPSLITAPKLGLAIIMRRLLRQPATQARRRQPPHHKESLRAGTGQVVSRHRGTTTRSMGLTCLHARARHTIPAITSNDHLRPLRQLHSCLGSGTVPLWQCRLLPAKVSMTPPPQLLCLCRARSRRRNGRSARLPLPSEPLHRITPMPRKQDSRPPTRHPIGLLRDL